MFWTLYDPLVKRDIDGPRSSVRDIHLPRPIRRASPRTADTVLFLLEDADIIVTESPAPLFH